MSHATFGKWPDAIEDNRRLHNRDSDTEYGIARLVSPTPPQTNDDLDADIIYLAVGGYKAQEIADELGCSIFDVEDMLLTRGDI